jgi:hypothetical protein
MRREDEKDYNGVGLILLNKIVFDKTVMCTMCDREGAQSQ